VEDLTRACAAIGGCATGSAVATPAFGIRTARIIVHAVGPVFANHTPDDARRLLRSAYASAMVCAHEHDCTSIAFPAISTGIYGYPLMEAAAVAAEVCRVESARLGLAVKLVAFDARTADALRLAVCG
jgi:O-acetyl-ADP-ribose deacetylase (regulator of RNase III)